MSDVTEMPDGSAEVEIPDEFSDVQEMPDGSAVVSLDEEEDSEVNMEFYENLAEVLNPHDLDILAIRYIDLLEKDKDARSKRDEQYEEGIRRTGMGNDAPGGATFAGASKVVHPVLAEGCVDFAARAIKEMFPPDGPVRTKIIGKVDDAKEQRAERKRDFLNWQITEQIEEFRDEQEQLLTQLPLGGSQYLKLWFDEQKKRPCVEFLPIDRMILPFAATNFYTAQRAAEVHEITQYEFKRRVANKMYRDVEVVRAVMEPDQSKSSKATNKIEGKDFSDNEDGVRTVFHIYVYLELEDDPVTKGTMAPYIMMVDLLTTDVVGLYRNWEEKDETMTKLDWIVEFKFIPWRGAFAIGLPHLIGGLAAALTGSLRALLDSAHINNAATMLKLKGAKVSGQSQQVDVTQIAEIEGAPGVDDIRKIAMPFPFNPPSAVLFQLMGFLQDAAKGVVTTSEEKIADVTANAPVGTTQALIEQGAAVFSAIHARLHSSQARVLKILCRLNRWHLDEQKKGEVVENLEVTKEDFARNTDVVPVSDPHIFSETQRMAQNQAVLALMDKYPAAFQPKKVIERTLKQMKVPNINELMADTPAPEQRTIADENAAMCVGQPSYAYLPQDHIAHIQGHLMFANDPVFGANPFMAPVITGHMIEHIKQHMTLWYLNRMNGYVAEYRDGRPIEDYENPKLTGVIDQIYATVGQHVAMDSQETFQQLMPAIMQLMQRQQQMQGQPQLPPEAQVVKETAMAETQRKAAKDQADMEADKQKLAFAAKKDQDDNQTKLIIAGKQSMQDQQKQVDAQAHEQALQEAQQAHEQALKGIGQQHEADMQGSDQAHNLMQQAMQPQPQGEDDET